MFTDGEHVETESSLETERIQRQKVHLKNMQKHGGCEADGMLRQRMLNTKYIELKMLQRQIVCRDRDDQVTVSMYRQSMKEKETMQRHYIQNVQGEYVEAEYFETEWLQIQKINRE